MLGIGQLQKETTNMCKHIYLYAMYNSVTACLYDYRTLHVFAITYVEPILDNQEMQTQCTFILSCMVLLSVLIYNEKLQVLKNICRITLSGFAKGLPQFQITLMALGIKWNL